LGTGAEPLSPNLLTFYQSDGHFKGIGGSALSRLTEALSKIDGVEVFPYEDTIINGKLSIYFTYKRGQSSIEDKAKFIDWLARILGKSNKGAGYDTNISMWWIGSKGISGVNEPFFRIDVLLPHVEKLLNLLGTAKDIGPTFCLALTTNHHERSTANIVEHATFYRDWIFTFKLMSWATTLAFIMTLLKRISLSLTKPLSLWHTKIIEGDNQECQS
jgi:hypothetical protein